MPLASIELNQTGDRAPLLALEREEIQLTIARYITQSYLVDDTAWVAHLNETYKRLRKQQIAKRLKRFLFGSIKSVRKVRGGYGQVWSLDMYPGNPVVDDSVHWLSWGRTGLKVKGWAEKRVHLQLIAQVVNALRPANVLEVGSGNGGMSMMLSEMCPPGTIFHGIELTSTGVMKARQIQSGEGLPDGMEKFLPLPRVAPGAFKSVNFQEGNAKQLPFADRSIDLVFTSLALEQMNAVQIEVLHEIARVSAAHVLMIEPFPDFNTTREQRCYTSSNEYFSVPVSALANHGLHPLAVFSDLPTKIYRGAGAVLARPA